MSQKLSIKCPACAKTLNFDTSELAHKKLLTCKYCDWDFTLTPNLIITPTISPQVNLTNLKPTKPTEKVSLTLQLSEETKKINISHNLQISESSEKIAKINLKPQTFDKKIGINLQPQKSHGLDEQSLNKLINPANLSTKTSAFNQSQKTESDLFQDLQLPMRSNTSTKSNFKLTWLILCAFALLGLYFQYVHYNLAKLAQNQEWRNSLTLWCKVTRCMVPPQVDLSHLNLDYISVTSHPKFSDALKINLVIDNQANFHQPFPNLELDFSDFNHTIIAQRIFTPNEYLAGEAAGMQLIPAHTKVKVALEVLDPGKNTTNYHLTFSEQNLQN